MENVSNTTMRKFALNSMAEVSEWARHLLEFNLNMTEEQIVDELTAIVEQTQFVLDIFKKEK